MRMGGEIIIGYAVPRATMAVEAARFRGSEIDLFTDDRRSALYRIDATA
jgi:hypothetical protein